jgi:hypothetical protein
MQTLKEFIDCSSADVRSLSAFYSEVVSHLSLSMLPLCFRFAPFNLFTVYRVKAQMDLLFILEKTLQNFLLSKVIFMPIDPCMEMVYLRC